MSDISNNEALHFPFDEPTGTSGANHSTVYDYSHNAIHTVLKGTAEIVGGKIGNCLKIGGNGGNEQTAFPFDLTGNYTITMWVRRDVTPADDTFKADTISIFFHADNPDDSTEKAYDLSIDWMHLAVVKEGTTIKVYIDGQLLDTFTITAQPDYVLILQDGSNEEQTYASIDDFTVYDIPLTAEEISGLVNTSAHQLRYYLNGIDIRETYGIRFEKSNGLLSRPKLKALTKVDWPDYHGEVVDLTGKRVEARTITLKGWMLAENKTDFIQKWNEFISIFDADGTQRLMVDVHPTKPLVYEVYLEDELDTEKRWSDSTMVGTFTIKLKEPDPVKRVIRQLVTSTSADSRNLNIQMTSQKAVTIYWGDGTKDEDLNGTINKTHQYPEGAATYYAIIGGVIEDISNFSTTGIVVWNKI